jgi:hypothetical protein
MLIEFRIPMPLTYEQYLKGSTYIQMYPKLNTSQVELTKYEKFENETGKGIFTHKVITPKNVANWVYYFFPENWIKAHEYCYNSIE